MPKDTSLLSEVAMFVAGALAVTLISGRRREKAAPVEAPVAENHPDVAELRRALAALESRVAGQESASAKRFGQIEASIEEQSTRVNEMPSTDQIVSAMEQLIGRTMASLDDRLTTQAHAIENLKTTVSQTDSLLERVLEALDALNASVEPVELEEQLLKQVV